MYGFSRCMGDGVWTVTVETELVDSCGHHLKDAFAYLLQANGNAVDKDVTVTVHWNPESKIKIRWEDSSESKT